MKKEKGSLGGHEGDKSPSGHRLLSETDGKLMLRTKVFEHKHFPILKYERNDIRAKEAYNKLNYRYNLGETWFFTCRERDEERIFSVSFRLFSWLTYRNMLFEPGICKDFRSQCLKAKCGSILMDKKYKFSFKTSYTLKRVNAMNESLKSSLCWILFKKKKVD